MVLSNIVARSLKVTHEVKLKKIKSVQQQQKASELHAKADTWQMYMQSTSRILYSFVRQKQASKKGGRAGQRRVRAKKKEDLN